jgi:Tannase and feruloyl esterase
MTEMRALPVALFVALAAGRAFDAPPPGARVASCERVASVTLPHGSIASAQAVDAGTVVAGTSIAAPRAFCRVSASLQPSADSDITISPASSTVYYAEVVRTLGGAENVHASYRLFMAPGMGHCGGGEGPNTFDMVTALEQWVEQGRAPDRILASHSTDGVVDRTRPLCPYPQTAAYQGSGSIDDAANFECRSAR